MSKRKQYYLKIKCENEEKAHDVALAYYTFRTPSISENGNTYSLDILLEDMGLLERGEVTFDFKSNLSVKLVVALVRVAMKKLRTIPKHKGWKINYSLTQQILHA